MAQTRKLKIGLVQCKVEQGDTDYNTKHQVQMIREAASQGADIVCLPELVNTGYYLTQEKFVELAETQSGPYIQTLSKLAKELRIYIIAGYCEASETVPGRCYNSAIFISDKGEVIGNMQKVYVWGEERLKFRFGDKFPVFDTPIGKIGIMICADVEFPEPSRIMALKGAEIVFVPAVWSIPAARRWDVDLAGNALFNLMYMVGSNPVGETLCGSSQIFAPNGELVAAASKTEEEVLVAEIDLDNVLETRGRIPYMNYFIEDTFSMDAVDKY